MKRKWFLWGLLLLIGFYLLGRLIATIELDHLGGYVQQINVSLLLLAIFLYFLMVFTRAGKWYILSLYHSIKIPFSQFLGRYFMYYSVSSLTPFRSGDLFAPFIISKNSNLRYKLYHTMIIDRLIEYIVLLGLFICSFWYMLRYINFPIYYTMLIFITLLIGAVGFYIFSYVVYTDKIRFKIPRIKKVILFFKDALIFFATLEKRVIIYQFLISIFVWVLDFLYVFIIMKAIGLKSLLFIHSLVSQVGSTIFSIITFVPAGIGTGAVSYVYLGKLFNYKEELLIVGTVLAKLTFLFILLLLVVLGFCILKLFRSKERSL